MKTLLHLLIIAALFFVGARVAGSAAAFVPLKVFQTEPAHFPLRLLDAGIKQGTARLIAEVGPDGALADCLVVAYSRREFADEAVRVVRRWAFEPSLLGGRPIRSRVELAFEFRMEGMLVRQVWFDERDPEDARDQTRNAFSARTLGELDRLPRATAASSPPVLLDQAGKRVEGRVLVKFYIDENGRPRFPQVVSEDNAALGWAALDAVAHWQFEPPLHAGAPTLAIAHQTFVWPGEPK